MNYRPIRSVIMYVFIILIFSLSFSAAASPGRMYGLGLTEDNQAWMLNAEESYFLDNPAILMQLPPEIWAELTDLQAGLLINPLENINGYLLLGAPIDMSGFAAIPAGTAPFPNLTTELIRLGLGLSLGSNLDLGFSVGAGINSYVNTAVAAGENFSNLVINFNGGVLLALNNKMNIDAAGGGSFWNVKRDFEVATTPDYAATDFDVYALGRLNWELISQNMFHIFGKYNFTNRSYTLGNTAVGSNAHIVTAGFADEMQLLENVLILAGTDFLGSFSTVNGIADRDLTFNVHAGTEIGFTKNFIGRMGLSKVAWEQKFDPASNVTTSSSGALSILCGFGLLLGNFALDMHLTRNLLVLGPNFITGGDFDPWTAEASVTYYFDKTKGDGKK